MDREKAVERCQNCEHCKLFKQQDNVQYLSCELAGNKWICEVEDCPRGNIYATCTS